MKGLDQSIEKFSQGIRLLAAQFATLGTVLQLALIALAVLAASLLGSYTRKRIDLISMTMGWPPLLRRAVRAIAYNAGIIYFLILALILRAGLYTSMTPGRIDLLTIAAKLATAWIVIALLTSVINNTLVHRVVAATALTIAALSILGLLEPTLAALDAAGLVIGGLRITVLLALETTILLLLALWLALTFSNFLDWRLSTYRDLTPSLRVLLSKLYRIALVSFAIIIVLSSVGIDLSALALFSGAVGVGVGFGLQKIVSNLVSGIILLADKSIKPGDVISVGDHFGWVDTMGARYTSVVSRDGREYLIPNEDFVTQRVVNWSFSNDRVRLDVKFGTSYASDPHAVCRLAVEAARAVTRVLSEPSPTCHLLAFGNSSLDFMLRFWIKDPIDGLTTVRGPVLMALWDALKREGIEIPFPQRDVHMKEPVRVIVEPDKKT